MTLQSIIISSGCLFLIVSSYLRSIYHKYCNENIRGHKSNYKKEEIMFQTIFIAPICVHTKAKSHNTPFKLYTTNCEADMCKMLFGRITCGFACLPGNLLYTIIKNDVSCSHYICFIVYSGLLKNHLFYCIFEKNYIQNYQILYDG